MNFRKIFRLACAGVCVAALALSSSCKNASKAKPIVDEVVNSYKAASKSDAIRYLKMQNRIQMAEDIYNDLTAPNPCSTCNGYGVVYQIDPYGNAVRDYYGNVQFFYCPTCGGTGQD